ncbi:hypothetical protein COOONC_27493 [Cooperia oncophora]
MRSNAGNDDIILRAMSMIMTQFHVPAEFPLIVRTTFNVKEDLLHVLRNGTESQRVSRIDVLGITLLQQFASSVLNVIVIIYHMEGTPGAQKN